MPRDESTATSSHDLTGGPGRPVTMKGVATIAASTSASTLLMEGSMTVFARPSQPVTLHYDSRVMARRRANLLANKGIASPTSTTND
jgi:hypothetical protein